MEEMTAQVFKLITREMAAEILSVSLTTLDALIAESVIPAPKPLGSNRRLYWLPEAFEGHLRRLLGGSESAAAVLKAPATPESPRPAQEISTPYRACASPNQSKQSDLRARQEKRIKRLNE
jgi:excisionase family DNA binding protein